MNTPVASQLEILLMSMELGNKEWRLRFSNQMREREVIIPARDLEKLRQAIATSKEKLKLSAGCRVVSCYEAGRDGFWLHRCLEKLGVENLVVDSASIEVNRRKRRAKTDRVDAIKLLGMLIRHVIYQEKKMWQIVKVLTEEQEDARRRHREQDRLKKERIGHIARIKSLLVLHGISAKRLNPEVETYRDWANAPLLEATREELRREFERLGIVEKQIRELSKNRMQQIESEATPGDRATAKLMRLKSIGLETASALGFELFGCRKFNNRRQVGSFAGLTGTPYQSGDSNHEQGISKAGNVRVRHKMVEVSWLWLRFQKESALTKWYFKNYGPDSPRKRRVGIVAVARKLLVALWKYVEFGEMPEGAMLKVA